MSDVEDMRVLADEATMMAPPARVATIRKRVKAENPWSDAFCTPQALAERFGKFQTDPASNPRSHIDAAWAYMLEKHLDGLKLPWWERTFVNWPYSSPMPWALKAQHEMAIGNCTELVVLCKLDPSTLWWGVITEAPATECTCGYANGRLISAHTIHCPSAWALDRWDFNDRIQFDEHPDSIAWRIARRDEAIARGDAKIPPLKTSNNFASVVLHHRRESEPMLDLRDLATLWHKR